MEPSSQLLLDLTQALGPMGFVMWLVHRTTTHTIPRLAKSFEEGIDRQRTDFKEMITEQRKDFENMITREQDKTERVIAALQQKQQ